MSIPVSDTCNFFPLMLKVDVVAERAHVHSCARFWCYKWDVVLLLSFASIKCINQVLTCCLVEYLVWCKAAIRGLEFVGFRKHFTETYLHSLISKYFKSGATWSFVKTLTLCSMFVVYSEVTSLMYGVISRGWACIVDMDWIHRGYVSLL